MVGGWVGGWWGKSSLYTISVETETGTELGEKDRAVLPKQKLIVYISRFQKSSLNIPPPQKKPLTAKKAPKSPKKVQKRPQI